jgi:hypothetical protein
LRADEGINQQAKIAADNHLPGLSHTGSLAVRLGRRRRRVEAAKFAQHRLAGPTRNGQAMGLVGDGQTAAARSRPRSGLVQPPRSGAQQNWSGADVMPIRHRPCAPWSRGAEQRRLRHRQRALNHSCRAG